MIDNVKEQQEEETSGHKGESSLLEASETSNNFTEEDVEELEDKDDNEEDKGTGVKDFVGDGNCDKDTNAGGGPTQWIQFLSPRERMEALGAMAKANAYPLMSLRNNTKIARKGKAAQNFLKKSRKTSVRKSEVLLGGRGAATTTS